MYTQNQIPTEVQILFGMQVAKSECVFGLVSMQGSQTFIPTLKKWMSDIHFFV